MNKLTDLVLVGTMLLVPWTAAAVSSEGKAEFERCNAKFVTGRKVWASAAARVSQTAKQLDTAGLYEGLASIERQHAEMCIERKKLDDAGQGVRDEIFRSSQIEFEVAAARFLTRLGVVVRMPINDLNMVATFVPYRGDDSADRTEHCYNPGRQVSWLSPTEFEAWNKVREPIRLKQTQTIDALAASFNAIRLKVAADRGRVKAVKKLANGTLQLSMKNLYGGSECVHTKNWSWNGSFWSDCSYKGAVEKEIYPFTVLLPADRVPPQGVHVGDVISVWGLRTPGPDPRQPADHGSYNGLVVVRLQRGDKRLIELNLEDYLDQCNRY